MGIEQNQQKTIDQFNKWALNYDKGIWSVYFNYCYKTVINHTFQHLLNAEKVLDIGCGTGNLLIALSKFKSIKSLAGIDISKKMIKLANLKKEKLKNKENLTFFIDNAHRMQFPNNSFDIIFSLNSFHHYGEAIKEISRVLKPDGIFVLTDNFIDNFFRRIWVKLLKIYFKESDVKYYNKKQINGLFEDSGLKVLQQKTLLYFILISICKKN